MGDLPRANMTRLRPHSTARACRGAPVFAVLFSLFIFPMLYSAFENEGMHMGARIGFIALAALMAWYSLGQLWAWAVGGQAELALAQVPVPHGREVPVKFTLAREVTQREWSLNVSMLGPQEEDSSFGTNWTQTFAAQPTGSHEVSTTILIPAHVTPTKASSGRDLTIATLMLKSGRMNWMFLVETQSGPGQQRP